jgi:hypothetical protein
MGLFRGDVSLREPDGCRARVNAVPSLKATG